MPGRECHAKTSRGRRSSTEKTKVTLQENPFGRKGAIHIQHVIESYHGKFIRKTRLENLWHSGILL